MPYLLRKSADWNIQIKRPFVFCLYKYTKFCTVTVQKTKKIAPLECKKTNYYHQIFSYYYALHTFTSCTIQFFCFGLIIAPGHFPAVHKKTTEFLQSFCLFPKHFLYFLAMRSRSSLVR